MALKCELSRHRSVAARIGLARELYSLAICILCGFIFGDGHVFLAGPVSSVC